MSDGGKSRRFQRFKNDLIYGGLRFLFALARWCPLRWGMPLGAAIASLVYRIAPHERRLALLHLRVAFPDWTEAQRRAVAEESYRNLGRSFFELFHFDELLATCKTDRPYVRFVGFEHVDQAFAQKRGGIFFTGHLGNWELMAAWFVAFTGYPGNEIVRRLYDERIDKILNDHRRRYRYKPLSRGGKDLVNDIIRVLADNEMLGILIDQDTKVRGVFADWFGHPAWTPSGAAYLCYQADLDIMMMTIHRDPAGGHVMEISPPLPRPRTGDPKADILAYTQMMNARLQDHISRHPTEWVWMHRRWKTRPPGEPAALNPAPKPPKPQRRWRWLDRLASGVATRLSWETADRLGALAGRAVGRLARGVRRQAQRNVAAAFPLKSTAEREAVVRASFAQLGRTLAAYLRAPLMDARFFRERVSIEGLERLDAALAQGKGVVLAAAHFGGWDLAWWKLASLGYAVDLAEARGRSYPDLRLAWLRRARGLQLVSGAHGEAAASALRAGRILAVPVDHRFSADGQATAAFLGRPSVGAGALERLSREAGAPVLVAHSRRVGPGRWRVEVAVAPPSAADGLCALERIALTCPEQQFWLG